MDELRQARCDLLEVRGERPIADRERGELLMHLGRARIEPAIDVAANFSAMKRDKVIAASAALDAAALDKEISDKAKELPSKFDAA